MGCYTTYWECFKWPPTSLFSLSRGQLWLVLDLWFLNLDMWFQVRLLTVVVGCRHSAVKLKSDSGCYVKIRCYVKKIAAVTSQWRWLVGLRGYIFTMSIKLMQRWFYCFSSRPHLRRQTWFVRNPWSLILSGSIEICSCLVLEPKVDWSRLGMVINVSKVSLVVWLNSDCKARNGVKIFLSLW